MSATDQSIGEGLLPEINFDCSQGEAVQLVRLAGKSFELTAEGEAFLRSLEGYVGVCAVAGKLRTGKSFLLNRIIGLERRWGFAVSGTVDACTKGLWVWSQPVHNDRQNLNIVFMDTEGLDSLERDAEVDAKLFALTALFSSYLIFNSVGSIDQTAINGLALVAGLARTVVASEGEEALNEYVLASYAPKLLWVLRDFALEPRDARGRAVSPRAYLESALSSMAVPEPGQARGFERDQSLRASILNFFRHRDCATLVRPVASEQELQALPGLADSRLRPEFVAQLNLIRNKVWQHCSAKTVKGTPLTPPLLLALMKQVIAAFNAKAVPSLNSAWKSLLREELERAERKALGLHARPVSPQPEGVEALQRSFLSARTSALLHFQRVSFAGECLPDLYEEVLGCLRAELEARERIAVDDFRKKCIESDEERAIKLYSSFLKSREARSVESEDVGDVLLKEVYQPLMAQSKADPVTAIASITEKFSGTLLAKISSALEVERKARLLQSEKSSEREKELSLMQGETLTQKEQQIQELEAQIEQLNEQIRKAQGLDTSQQAQLLAKKEQIDSRSAEVKAKSNELGNALSENRLLIAEKKKKKLKICG